MFTSQLVLHAYVLTRQHALRAYELTCQLVLRTYVLASLTCSRDHVLKFLMCSRANVFLRAYVFICYNFKYRKKFSIIFSLSFSCEIKLCLKSPRQAGMSLEAFFGGIQLYIPAYILPSENL